MSGRKHALPVETRQAVWDRYEAHSRGLLERRAHDWEDIVLLARDAIASVPFERYDAVIVDEAQDLSCAMVALTERCHNRRPRSRARPTGRTTPISPHRQRTAGSCSDRYVSCC